jgi:3-hydroxybutyryl-CoA dehydrogenase
MSAGDHVSVVGAGTMGSGIAQVFAVSGFSTTLIDVEERQLERARAAIEQSLDRLVTKGAIDDEARALALGRLQLAASIDGVSGSTALVEAIVEDSALKRAVFERVSRLLPSPALLLSNTSSISITSLAAGADQPERVAGMHFFNPVPLMALVEVVRGERTSEQTVDRVVALASRLGKQPVVVNDYPGFISNRILMPMINEAVFALLEGVAERDAVDQVARLGMNHPMGPLQLADLIGLDVCLHILEVLHRDLGDDKYRPCPLLRRMVAAGKLGRKSGHGFYDY